MANLVITDITLTAGSKPDVAQLLEPVTPYDLLYLDSASGKWGLAEAVAGKDSAVLMALSAGVADEYIVTLPFQGNIEFPGQTFVVGTQYVLSATPGKMAPRSDLGTGAVLTNLFLGASATLARIRRDATGIVLP